MQLKRVAEAKLPTPWGDFLMVGFEELAPGPDHGALVYGDISGHTPVLARVHSECLTGDALLNFMQLKRVAEAKLPTPWGDFLMVGFEELAPGPDHGALVYGDISGHTPVLARVHSECLTGDALLSYPSECFFQIEAALTQIA